MLRIHVCLFPPSPVALSISIFLNDFSVELADQFYDKRREKFKFLVPSSLFLSAVVIISECPFDDSSVGMMVSDIEES